MISQSKLKEQLNYEESTGLFTRKVSPNGKNKVGELAGCITKHGYIEISVLGKSYKAHRLAWLYVYGKHANKHLDHINGNKLDNRIENLREVSVSENMTNKTIGKNNKSGKVGVMFSKSKQKWVAQITVDGNRKCLYTGDSKEDAIKARQEAEVKFGFTTRDDIVDTEELEKLYKNAKRTKLGKGRTKLRLLSEIYYNQRSNSKSRGMRMPEYTKEEFVEWSMSQTKFHELFNEWKNSGEEKYLVPSIDRILDTVHYCFGNIEWTTFGENEKRFKLSKINGTTTKTDAKEVMQIDCETGEVVNIFHSTAEASRVTEIPQHVISHSARKESTRSKYNYIWRYVR